MSIRNGVQLITYPDSLGGNLANIHKLLEKQIPGAITGVHILPFFPSTADRGFCPTRYDVVDPAFGSWGDIRNISQKFDLMVDLILNHISSESEYFKNYVSHGKDSPFYELFLQISKVYGTPRIPESQKDVIYLRKPTLPEREITFPDGSSEWIWQTFEFLQQVDLDVNSQIYRQIFTEFINKFAENGVKMIRIDAAPYVIKKAGTSCFMVEPEIWEFLKWVESVTQDHETELLPELHSHYTRQLQFAEHGYWVYDFNLPLLLIYTLEKANSTYLREWIKICPRQQITTLDTHDGIPVEDLIDILPETAMEEITKVIISRGANINYNHSGGKDVVYQLNCTYFDALGGDDIRYILSRAIQFFCPGIPQVYYTGLMVGKNDYEMLNNYQGERIGAWGRDINRHNYTQSEIEENLRRPVVQQLLSLCRLRSSHQAFDGDISIGETDGDKLEIVWRNSDHLASLRVDLVNSIGIIRYTDLQDPYVYHTININKEDITLPKKYVEILIKDVQSESSFSGE